MIPDLTQNYCWLLCSLPLSLPVPARACPCSTHAHMHLMTVLPHSVSIRIASCPSTPFSLNFVYWAKALLRSVSLKVDQVTLFVSGFEYADFFRDVNLFINHGALTYPYHQHVMHKPVLGPVSLPFDIYPKIRASSYFILVSSHSVRSLILNIPRT